MRRKKIIEACPDSQPPYALLRAGFPYLKTIGMIRTTPSPVDIAVLDKNNLYVLCRGRGVILNSLDDDYPLRRSPMGGNGDGNIKNYYRLFLNNKKKTTEKVNLFGDKLVSYKLK